MEPKYAFRKPGRETVVAIVNPGARPCLMTLKIALEDGYTILDWPKDRTGAYVEEKELPRHVPKSSAASGDAGMAAEAKLAFRVPGARRALPIVDGEAARTPIALSKAKADGFTILAWPEDPAGPVAAVDLPDYLPEAPDPALADRYARIAALCNASESVGVDREVIRTLANSKVSTDEALGFLRGLSPRAISNQFRGKLDNEPMTEAPATPDDPRAARLRELRGNVSPKKETLSTAALIAADTDAERSRSLEIKVVGILSRAERGDRAALAKKKEIDSACILARANNLSLIHALAVAGVTL